MCEERIRLGAWDPQEIKVVVSLLDERSTLFATSYVVAVIVESFLM
jgi:hypothetical protein